MRISAADAIGPAFTRTMNICFRPFNIGKWFVMGFCAFLSTCGEGGSGNFQQLNSSSRRGGVGGGGGGGGGGPVFTEVSRFISTNLIWIIPAVIILFIVMLAISLAVVYLRCRGRFMFLDNVTLNRAAVSEPWHTYGAQAMSYFWFNLLLMAISFGTLIVVGGLCALVALPDISSGRFDGMGILAIVLGVLLLLPTFIFLAIIQLYAYDFVLPIMMIRKVMFRGAWNEAKVTVFRGNIGQLFVFYLLKMLLGLAGGIIGMIAICATCCIGALPYLSSVLLLPILVFSRAYALTFLEQFHNDYKLMSDRPYEQPGFPVEPQNPFEQPLR